MRLTCSLLTGVILILISTSGVTPAQPNAPLSKDEIASLAGTLRGLLVQHAPQVLHESAPNWGHTEKAANGLKWKPGKVLPIRPKLSYGEKNDGIWRKIKLTTWNLPDTLVLDLRRVRRGEPGQMLFDVFVSFDAKVDFDQERWERGIKLYDSSTRARLRARALLQCEAVTRLEPNGTFIPDAVFRLRVLKADLGYDNLVVEHIAGVGGDMAKMLGEGVHSLVSQLRPSLERQLLAKANAAIVKAGDTKEVRLGLTGLFNQKDVLTDSAINLLNKDGKRK